MSGKRQATSDLNHENWDREDEPEEMGTFRTATKDELKSRVIKKARRKLPDAISNDGSDGSGSAETKSIFSGFAGFPKTATSTTTPMMGAFSFLSKIPAVDSSATSTTNTAAGSLVQSESTEKKSETEAGSSNTSVTTSTAPVKNYDFEKSNEYYGKLKGLNEAVSSWIKLHVDKNPICILTPIFKDYDNYLNDINKKENRTEILPTVQIKAATNSGKPTQTFSSFKFSTTPASAAPATSTSPSTFSFGSAITQSSTEASTKTDNKPESLKTNGFSWSKDDNKFGFSFGNASSTTTTGDDKPTSTVFSFPNAKPNTNTFMFGNVAAHSAAPAAPSTSESIIVDEEDDEPPKVEFKQVVEEDAIFSKKCKFFVKSDGKFSDRGVGTLYFKPIKESGKTQLLLRADTNLGNILANFILNESIPSQRMGKNMVMLVCVPTPEFEKATPILLRVKTSEEADELLQTIEKYKK